MRTKKVKSKKIELAKQPRKKKSIKKIAKTIANLIPGQGEIDWDAETKRIINYIRDTGAKLAYIDLFCGFGGTTAGVDRAKNKNDEKFAVVILGINHDDIALACHKAHHPETLHLREDIRKVALEPIAKMIAAIRKAFPDIKIVIWTSAECTHHSRAKGGDSRDPDSRSLAEELYRYEKFIKPDLIQVENVTEFRSWGPLMQKKFDMKTLDLRQYRHKMTHPEYGKLISKNSTVWITKTGLAFKKDKKKGVTEWMIPIPERKAEYFNEWRDHLKSLGYAYQDRDINSADHGAFTARLRYYGQFSKGMPIVWPNPTHSKDPQKHFLKFGINLLKHNAVREVLDFADTGESIFIPDRIKSNQTFKRLLEGGVKHCAGGKEKYTSNKKIYEHWLATGELNIPYEDTDERGQFLIKYNSSKPAENDFKNSIVDVNNPSPTLPCRNMLAKTHFDFMIKYYSGKPEYKNYSMDGPAHTLRTSDGQAKVCAQILPFILQYNKGYDLNSVDEPNRPLTTQPKFYTASFIQQRNSGNPSSKTVSVEGPARTITQTGGNQDLVQVENILPYIFNYHANGHNCHNINNPSPTICAADVHAIATPQPFIFRQFTSGGTDASVNDAAGSIPSVPKMNLISPQWIMDTQYNNIGRGVNEPALTVTADRHYPYIVNPSYFGSSSSVDRPSPVVVARQDKAPLHLAQVEFGDQAYYGIVIYSTDSPEIKELKYFMAVYGIVDIKMRMLKEIELLPIQGFPPDYIEKVRAMGIKVTGTNAKKYIGNSQEVTTARCLVESYAPYLDNDNNLKKVA